MLQLIYIIHRFANYHKPTFQQAAYLKVPYITKRIHLKLYVKYMVSIRCKMMVKEVLQELGLAYKTINLGEVEMDDITHSQREHLKIALLKFGLEVMDDKKAMLIEKIKNVIIEMGALFGRVTRNKFLLFPE